jgi:hypothetical protein
MSKNRQYYGICKPQPWEPNREYLEGMVLLGSTEFEVRGRLAECRTHFEEYGVNEAVWGPVRTIFNAFADAEIAGARLADTSPDSPPDIKASRAAAYTDALARLEDVRENSGMYGQAAEWSEINRAITDLETTYRRLAWLGQPSMKPKPSPPKPKTKPHPRFFPKGGRRTRRRKGTTRHQRKKRSSTYKTYRKSAA